MRDERSGTPAKPSMAQIIALACAFWISQSLAWYLFSGFLMSGRGGLLGPLSAGVFTVFFILHLFRPWSKAAAILGLCSVGVFTGFIEYVKSPTLVHSFTSAEFAALFSVALAFAGWLLDAGKCWRLAGEAHSHDRLKLSDNSSHDEPGVTHRGAFKLL